MKLLFDLYEFVSYGLCNEFCSAAVAITLKYGKFLAS